MTSASCTHPEQVARAGGLDVSFLEAATSLCRLQAGPAADAEGGHAEDHVGVGAPLDSEAAPLGPGNRAAVTPGSPGPGVGAVVLTVQHRSNADISDW